MLALPSWSMGEIEPPDIEYSFSNKEKECGKLATKERSFKCMERKENELPRQMCERLAEKLEPKEPTKLQKGSWVPAKTVSSKPSLMQRAELCLERSLPRHLPKSETPLLPKPFDMKTAHGHKQTQPRPTAKVAQLPLNSSKHAREQKSESAKSELQRQELSACPLFVKDSLDQEEERRRKWTPLVEDDLRGAVKPTSQIVSTSFKTRSFSYKEQSQDKPFLIRPKMGVFALYYILTKLGLISDSRSHFDTKQQVRINQEETELTHKERLAELKKAIDEEKSTKRWGVATQVFSWFTSFLGIMTGVALIMTGVGAVAGALILCAGLIMLTNQLMQLTGAWSKIMEKLPGTPQEKQTTLLWMQIGLTVLCFLLSGAGIVFGGFSGVKQAMEASQAVMGGVIMMGYGVTSFGEGVSNFRHRNRLAKIREHQKRLAQLKHRRDDLQEMAEASVQRIEQLFEDLARLLEFETELFRADQRTIR